MGDTGSAIVIPFDVKYVGENETPQAPRPRARVSWTPYSNGYIATRRLDYRKSWGRIARFCLNFKRVM
jgi:hypothetical protein